MYNISEQGIAVLHVNMVSLNVRGQKRYSTSLSISPICTFCLFLTMFGQRWGRSYRVVWRNWSFIWRQLSRDLSNARRGWRTLKGCAQKSPGPLFSCRPRCAIGARCKIQWRFYIWPLGGSATLCVILFACSMASLSVGVAINYKGFIICPLSAQQWVSVCCVWFVFCEFFLPLLIFCGYVFPKRKKTLCTNVTLLKCCCNRSSNFMFVDGKPAKFAEIVCGAKGVLAGGQCKATRNCKLSPHVRHQLISCRKFVLLWQIRETCVFLMQFALYVFVCRQIENLQQENLELVRSLAAQEEAVVYSNRQLDQRSSECQAFSRQLDAALVDVRQQVQLSLSITDIPGCFVF